MRCGLCDYETKYYGELEAHLWSVHPDEYGPKWRQFMEQFMVEERVAAPPKTRGR